MSSPFKILDLADTASGEEVQARFRLLASKHHPDRGGDVTTFIIYHQAYKAAMRVVKNRGCPACEGSGKIRKGSGFSFIEVTCPSCKGSGKE